MRTKVPKLFQRSKRKYDSCNQVDILVYALAHELKELRQDNKKTSNALVFL